MTGRKDGPTVDSSDVDVVLAYYLHEKRRYERYTEI